ncbi:sialate O-acetylesterase [Polaribacter litorisediminis]|uniref:sialate O-acetylesterase n=1 Tax=Polaribacter litorisediminis TaxID=1908341 RepID=UPI001CC00681|nr:sialate O-acetylesterase [Polaribacter litorisediminis]UAM97150.1 sialate O-acetylesterase [Polaribacter litorisediminis]
MQKKILLCCTIVFTAFTHFSQNLEKETFRLFFLGGQSNMEGHGLNSELPDSLSNTNQNVWIFHGMSAPDENENGGLGKWDHLKPGNGAGFKSDGFKNKLSHKFGPELSFGKKIQELYPGEKIAIIKYARGGSSIDRRAAREYGSWEIDFNGSVGVNQFDHFLTTLKGALNSKDIDGNGIEDILVPSGIIWMQGESDATITEDIASNYYSNLKRLMDLIRGAFREDDLAVVIGKISDSGKDNDGKTWEFGELVQYAQEKYVKTDKKASIVRSTKDYNYADPWHYNSNGYIDLGIKFAEAIYNLNKKND